jgi:hypothetical protein
MEPLEQTTVPWAQGVGRSNRPAPTKLLADSQDLIDRKGLVPGTGSYIGEGVDDARLRPQAVLEVYNHESPMSDCLRGCSGG